MTDTLFATRPASQAAKSDLPTLSAAQVRAHLLARDTEIALLDVREEDPYAQAHPLWAANLPLSRIELTPCPAVCAVRSTLGSVRSGLSG